MEQSIWHAYDEKCDYFFQCGEYKIINKNWVNSSIQLLKNNNSSLTLLDYIRWNQINSRPGGKRLNWFLSLKTYGFISILLSWNKKLVTMIGWQIFIITNIIIIWTNLLLMMVEYKYEVIGV